MAPEQCAVVLPGTDPAPLAEGSGEETWALLCAACLTPRKGHAVLFRALARLAALPMKPVSGYEPRAASRVVL